jgi:vacuolar-type H+-ATPase subunit C/Vma6
MAGPLSKYSFINAKLRARISKILPEEMFDELAKAPSVDGALALLRETPFGRLEEVYSQTGDLKQAELEMIRQLGVGAVQGYLLAEPALDIPDQLSLDP